jgi:hypothetical protein
MNMSQTPSPLLSAFIGVTLVAAATVGLSAAHHASPQAAQPTATIATVEDAKPFLGSWTTTFDSPQGAVTFDIDINVDSGDPGATVKNALIGESTVTDVTKAGTALILRYEVNVQGTQVSVDISLVPEGENLKANFSFMGGQFAASSLATRKK